MGGQFLGSIFCDFAYRHGMITGVSQPVQLSATGFPRRPLYSSGYKDHETRSNLILSFITHLLLFRPLPKPPSPITSRFDGGFFSLTSIFISDFSSSRLTAEPNHRSCNVSFQDLQRFSFHDRPPLQHNPPGDHTIPHNGLIRSLLKTCRTYANSA